MNRPDFSNYLAHFTSARKPVSNDAKNPAAAFAGVSPFDRIVSMLNTGTITASSMPWTGRHAVCFTECPWSSLIDHANQYSSYGIGFEKPKIFAAGGGPVYYVRADHWKKQSWDKHVQTFVTPFWPDYRPKDLKNPAFLKKSVDYSHEREWRIPHDFFFSLDDVKFVIVKSYEDVAQFPTKLKDKIGRQNFLIMDVYRTIERLWPVHNI